MLADGAVEAYWSGRCVFVTGHTGFKGAWLTKLLHRLGARVIGFALPPVSAPNLFDQLSIGALVESHFGDVRDLDEIRRLIKKTRPDTIFHLAAQALVRVGYEKPVETFATNTLGTVHVLEAARNEGVRNVIVVTSDKCYENREWIWGYREDEPLGGRDPYSASKGAAEIVTHAYAASYGRDDFRIASARAGNVVGGGDRSADRLIPDIVRSIDSGAPLRLRYPRAVRPWQHVLDALQGYLALAQAMERNGASGAWNFGPDDRAHMDVTTLAEAFYEAFGVAPAIEVDGAPQRHEAAYLRLDSTKARRLLGWSNRLNEIETIRWTAYWYREVARGADPSRVTDEQLDAFLEY